MNLDELHARVSGMVTVLKDALGKEMETVALTGIAMLTQRVTETGVSADGNPFKPYTPRYEQFKRGAVSTAKREGPKRKVARRVAVATADKPVGRFKGFVDFTLTGEMFRRIGIVEQRNEAGKFVVRVGARDDLNQDKMQGNDQSRPGWFRLSAQEKSILRDQSQERLTAIAQRFLS